MSILSQLTTVFNQLKETSTFETKKQILLENDSETLRYVLRFVFDPLISSGISATKYDKYDIDLSDFMYSVDYNDRVHVDGFQNLIQLLNDIRINNTGRREDVLKFKLYSHYSSKQDKETMRQIATQDLQIGMSVSSLNKVYGKDFIKKFAIKKGVAFDETKHLTNGEEFILSQKLDGNRIIVELSPADEKGDSVVTIKSPVGHVLEGYEDLQEVFSVVNGGEEGIVFDGEVVLKREDGMLGLSKDFNKLSSVCRKKGKKEGIVFVAFDCLTLKEFEEGKSSEVYTKRIKDLADNFYTIKSLNQTDLIQVVPLLYQGTNIEEIDKYMAIMVEEGKEGLMIDKPNEYYETKKSKQIFKVKKYYTVDLEVVGVEEGKNKGEAGAIQVYYKGLLNSVNVAIKEHKQTWFKNPNLIVGKILEIRFTEETEDGNMRHSRIIRVRDDKNEESYD